MMTPASPPMLSPTSSTDPVIAAGLILRRDSDAGPRWLLLRSNKHGEWGFPKGHADPGEDLRTTALRETLEETGIALVEITGERLELAYLLPNGRQKVTAYVPARTATTQVILSSEHSASAWCDAAQVLRRLPHENLRSLFRSYLGQCGLPC